MPHGEKGQTWVAVLITVALLGLMYFFLVKPIGDKANKIDRYLGNKTDPATLIGSIEENNAFHREQYTKIACSLQKLENPAAQAGGLCPSQGPTSRPTQPPPKP